DRAVLVDERVRGRDVGLGLVVVVVADEVLDRVMGKERLELAVQLRRQRLVRRHHQGRLLYLLDDVGDGIGLARAGNAQQGLAGEPGLEPRDEFLDRLRLVPRRLVGGDQFEPAAVIGHPASLSRTAIPYPNHGCPPIHAWTSPRDAGRRPIGPSHMRIFPTLPGFTVIEALLAMLIAALLLGTAIPAWSAASEAARAAEARSLLQSTLDVAMRHATVTGSEVVVCP